MDVEAVFNIYEGIAISLENSIKPPPGFTPSQGIRKARL
tara:strand:+ start:3643 stop:3759 length:117 start_codon:yes stop_codon:yes gene_type:complete